MKYYVYVAKVMFPILPVNSFTGILTKMRKFLIKTEGLAYESDTESPKQTHPAYTARGIILCIKG
jgi:hypothetical protein